MPRRQKMAVVGLLGMGLAVSCTGIARTYFMHMVTQVDADKTWDSYPLFSSAGLEMDVGMVSLAHPDIF
jgi:hypothetical protein